MTINSRLLVTLSIQLLIILCLLELGLRVLAPYNHNLRVLLYNPHLLGPYGQLNTLEELLNTRPKGFKPFAKREGFVLNSRSFRTQEYTDQKPSGYYRIVAIGDSFTAASGGVPYSQHWGVLLENNLKQTISDKLEVIKLGVGGVGPRFELRLWQLEGSKLEPDLVILAFCIGNDFTDEQDAVMPRSLADAMVETSYVLRLVRNLYRLTGVAHPAEIMLKEETETDGKQQGGYELKNYVYHPNEPTFSQPAFLQVVESRMAITHQANRAMFVTLFENLKPVLLFFRDAVVKANAKLVVMLIPDEYQVYPTLLLEVAKQSGQRPEDYEVSLPQSQLIQLFEENKIAYLDLLPVFRERAKTEVLYKLQDTHWNSEGNQLAAEELAKYLAKRF
jgi:lysophospholipase L1-like esterase